MLVVVAQRLSPREGWSIGAIELAIGVETMLLGDNLPELGTDLVTGLSSLDVDDLPHFDDDSKRLRLFFLFAQVVGNPDADGST